MDQSSLRAILAVKLRIARNAIGDARGVIKTRLESVGKIGNKTPIFQPLCTHADRVQNVFDHTTKYANAK